MYKVVARLNTATEIPRAIFILKSFNFVIVFKSDSDFSTRLAMSPGRRKGKAQVVTNMHLSAKFKIFRAKNCSQLKLSNSLWQTEQEVGSIHQIKYDIAVFRWKTWNFNFPLSSSVTGIKPKSFVKTCYLYFSDCLCCNNLNKKTIFSA